MILKSLIPLIAASTLCAQEAITPLQCRSLCFQRVPGHEKFVAPGRETNTTVDCPLPTSVPSEPFTCGMLNRKIVFRETAGGPIAATATVPAGMNKAMLFFVPQPQQEGKSLYKILVIDDSPKARPPGGAFVCNLYKGDVRFIIGEHKYQLNPGKMMNVEQPKQRDSFNMAAVAFQFQQNQNWRTASETMLRFTDGLRYLVFAYVDPKSNRPRLKTYRDIPRS